MRNVLVFPTLLGSAQQGLGVEAAFAQIRGSMIPPAALVITLQRSDRMFSRVTREKMCASATAFPRTGQEWRLSFFRRGAAGIPRRRRG